MHTVALTVELVSLEPNHRQYRHHCFSFLESFVGESEMKSKTVEEVNVN